MAFCTECGSNIPDEIKFCPMCGVPLAVVEKPPSVEAEETPHIVENQQTQETQEITDAQETIASAGQEEQPPTADGYEPIQPEPWAPVPQAPEPTVGIEAEPEQASAAEPETAATEANEPEPQAQAAAENESAAPEAVGSEPQTQAGSAEHEPEHTHEPPVFIMPEPEPPAVVEPEPAAAEPEPPAVVEPEPAAAEPESPAPVMPAPVYAAPEPWSPPPQTFATTLPPQPLHPESSAQFDIPPAQPPPYQPSVLPVIPKSNEMKPPKGSPYAVVGTFKYIGLMILYSIPIIGWIFCIVMAFSAENRNVRNYARAGLILAILGIAIALVGYFVFAWIFLEFYDILLDFTSAWF